MEERLEEVLGKYDFKVLKVTRVRGALCLDTDKGIKILRQGEFSKRKIAVEDKVTKLLFEKGYANVDYIIPNREEELITADSQGENYIVKQWFYGEECRVREKEDVICAAGNLGRLHRLLCTKEIIMEEELRQEALLSLLERHNREIKRIASYIRTKKQKNDFERCILKSFPEFYERSGTGLALLKESRLTELETKARGEGYLCHGSYTYHNVLMLRDGVATVNFEKTDYGFQLLDFYYFFRKVMEKNNWRVPLGDRLLKEYANYCPLHKEDLNLLGGLLYYPEKYWKILNHYYNNKKSWIAHKDMMKLSLVCEQELEKNLFLQQLFGLSF